MNTKPANPTESHVLQFCRSISALRPVMVDIRPEFDSEPMECFFNVRRQIERCGGNIRFDWAIWEWSNVYIEAEHHAVYDPGTGERWIDVTPAPDGERQRLFLPDGSAVFDFHGRGRRDNIRRALVNDRLITRFFELTSEKNKILNDVPGFGLVSLEGPSARKIIEIERERETLIVSLRMKYTRRNDVCFCGSGIKFKRCHGA